MKLFILFLFVLSFVTGLPVASPTAGEIDSSDPFAPRPIDGRPIIGRPVEPRPIESRLIGSRPIEARQKTVPGAYIIEFKEGYTHDAFRSYLEVKEVAYEFRYVYNHPEIFMGVSIQLKDDNMDYAKVASWEGVETITPVHVVTIPPLPGTQPLSMET